MNKIPVLSIQNLYKSFKMSNETNLDVLEDISLNVWQNEMVGLLGHSGCGKTTLLRIICAFESPESGSVLLDGMKHNSPCKNVIMLFQDFNQLLPWKTVIGNIIHPLMATRITDNRNDARERALRLISDVGLKDFVNAYPYQLSGGMKQRAAVARALALQPRVLLMDEPFAALDNITRNTLQLLTRDICEKHGITVVFVTHSIEEAVIMADRIIIMDKNPGSIKKVIENPDRNIHSTQKRALLVSDIMDLLGT